MTAVRIFSMSAGLDASTVTPGSTAPLESVTIPVIWLWAEAAPGRKPTKQGDEGHGVRDVMTHHISLQFRVWDTRRDERGGEGRDPAGCRCLDMSTAGSAARSASVTRP